MVWEKMLFEEFQDVATMPPTKFQLNRTYGSGRDVEKFEKLTTTDGRTADNRPRQKLTWSKAPGELIN